VICFWNGAVAVVCPKQYGWLFWYSLRVEKYPCHLDEFHLAARVDNTRIIRERHNDWFMHILLL
jgi:hypothetical protein